MCSMHRRRPRNRCELPSRKSRSSTMPVYQYKGYRNDGGAATGIIDAESQKVARVKLRKVGVFPTDMVEQGSAAAGSAAGSSAGSSSGSGHYPALSTTDVAMMTRQLATLL